MKRRKMRSMLRRKSKQKIDIPKHFEVLHKMLFSVLISTTFDLQYSLTNIHSGLWIYISKKSLYSKLEYVVLHLHSCWFLKTSDSKINYQPSVSGCFSLNIISLYQNIP